MSSHDGPSEAEFQESIRDWGLTKWYAWSTIVSGVVLAAASVLLLATGTRPGVAVVLVAAAIWLKLR